MTGPSFCYLPTWKPKKSKRINDIDLGNWKKEIEEKGIFLDSLWIFPGREKSGAHSNNYWGNFILQIPYQALIRFTREDIFSTHVFPNQSKLFGLAKSNPSQHWMWNTQLTVNKSVACFPVFSLQFHILLNYLMMIKSKPRWNFVCGEESGFKIFV